MLAFILQRLIQSAWVMLAVGFIAFLLFQYVGDPVLFLLGQDVTPARVAQLRAGFGSTVFHSVLSLRGECRAG
jgi:peptide/nickel transport system permease protein